MTDRLAFDGPAVRALREQIALACRVLHRLQTAPSHLSARLPGMQGFVVKTRGGNSGSATADHTCLIDEHGKAVAGGEPPLELALHVEIYRARPDVLAIGHTHQPAATAALDVPGVRPEIPRYPDSEQVRTHDQGVALARVLGSADLAHLHAHGTAVTGGGIDEVVARVVELETWARTLGQS